MTKQITFSKDCGKNLERIPSKAGAQFSAAGEALGSVLKSLRIVIYRDAFTETKCKIFTRVLNKSGPSPLPSPTATM